MNTVSNELVSAFFLNQRGGRQSDNDPFSNDGANIINDPILNTFDSSQVSSFAYLFNCTTIGRASDCMAVTS